MELRAVVEAGRMAEGPCPIVSDHEGIIGLARAGRTPRMCRPLWGELYLATEGKDVAFEWRRRNGSLGSRPANSLARDTAKGRGT
jgi:hypothetical protein